MIFFFSKVGVAAPGHIILLQACCWLFEAKPARLSILFLFVI
jgi:hypothetical protein